MSEAQGDPALLVPEFISTENKPYVEALLQHAARMKRGKDQDPVCMSDLVSAEGPDGQLQYVHLVLAGVGATCLLVTERCKTQLHTLVADTSFNHGMQLLACLGLPTSALCGCLRRQASVSWAWVGVQQEPSPPAQSPHHAIALTSHAHRRC
jgi:hypothetical protein